jgi:ketosteroid isomerase-like protein
MADFANPVHPSATGTHPGTYMASGTQRGASQQRRIASGIVFQQPVLPLLLLILCALAVPSARALLGPLARLDKGAAHKQIEQLEKDWQTAVLAQDNATLATLIADSYVGIGPDGTISGKAEELQARADGQERLQSYDQLDRKIRIYGTTAVVTSRVRIQGLYSGQPVLGEYRYTRVWSLIHGQWRIVSFEASRIHDTSARR